MFGQTDTTPVLLLTFGKSMLCPQPGWQALQDGTGICGSECLKFRLQRWVLPGREQEALLPYASLHARPPLAFRQLPGPGSHLAFE